MDHLLCVCVFLPLGGALVLGILPSERDRAIKGAALFLCLVELLLTLGLCWRFDSSAAGMQFVEHYEWVAPLGIYFHVGVDGFSLLLDMLNQVAHQFDNSVLALSANGSNFFLSR